MLTRDSKLRILYISELTYSTTERSARDPPGHFCYKTGFSNFFRVNANVEIHVMLLDISVERNQIIHS